MMRHKAYTIWGVIFCGSAVVFGAFGAHLLEQWLSADALNSYEVGVRYQFFHGLALLFLAADQSIPFTKRSALLFVVGTLLFSGSIYGLSLSNNGATLLGPVTPIGGLLLIIGWVNLLFGYVRS